MSGPSEAATVAMRDLSPGDIARHKGISQDEIWIHERSRDNVLRDCFGWVWNNSTDTWAYRRGQYGCVMEVCNINDMTERLIDALPLKAAKLIWPIAEEWNR